MGQLGDDADVRGERAGEVLEVSLGPRFERVPPAHPILRTWPFGEDVEGIPLWHDSTCVGGLPGALPTGHGS